MFKIKNFKEISTLFWPIALTIILTNTLSFVDSAMVANYDVLGVSAITVSRQIQFIFGPMYFAILTGINIYVVQYFANENYTKLKKLAGIGLTLLMTLSVINFLVLFLFQNIIVGLFVPINSDIGLLSIDYIYYFKYALLLTPIDMFFTYQFRAIKQPKIPLYMGVFQSIFNIIANLFLIYGLFFFPEMGIKGAALGTFLSRIVSISIYLVICKKINAPFIGKLKEMFSYDFKLLKEVVFNTIPLVIVELGFGLSNVIYTKIYTLSGVVAFTAFNISKTISFMINAFVIATANVSGIITGSTLAQAHDEKDPMIEEKLHDLFKFMGLNSIFILVVSFFILPIFIPFFTTESQYMTLIYELIIINGIWMAIRVFSSSFIAILKSGNDNKFIILIDAGSSYLVGIPITLLVYFIFTPSILVLRALIIVEVICKVSLGLYRYKKRKWVKKIS